MFYLVIVSVFVVLSDIEWGIREYGIHNTRFHLAKNIETVSIVKNTV